MFDIKRDKAIIEAGGFWCSGCLVGKPATEVSHDSRYCRGCYELLLKEAELEGSRRAGEWMPKKGKRLAEPSASTTSSVIKALPDNDNSCDKVAHEEMYGGNAVTDFVTGRIRELAAQGMSCRAIEKELAAVGVTISYRTIHRRLQGSMAI